MKSAVILAAIFTGANAFGVVPIQTRQATALNALVPEDQMTSEQKEMREIQLKWNEIRLLDREEAQNTLEGEWLEAYNRFYAKFDDDMTRMQEIADKLEPMINPPKVQRKTKGQRKRDAFARKKAQDAAHANNKY